MACKSVLVMNLIFWNTEGHEGRSAVITLTKIGASERPGRSSVAKYRVELMNSSVIFGTPMDTSCCGGQWIYVRYSWRRRMKDWNGRRVMNYSKAFHKGFRRTLSKDEKHV